MAFRFQAANNVNAREFDSSATEKKHLEKSSRKRDFKATEKPLSDHRRSNAVILVKSVEDVMRDLPTPPVCKILFLIFGICVSFLCYRWSLNLLTKEMLVRHHFPVIDL